MDLADAVLAGQTATDGQVPTLRQGVVTQTSPLLIRVGSATTAVACRALASYIPVVGDLVSVLVVDGDRLALGASPAAPRGIQFYAGFGTNGTTSGGTLAVVASVTVPALGYPYTASLAGIVFYANMTATGDTVEVEVDDSVTQLGGGRFGTVIGQQGTISPIGSNLYTGLAAVTFRTTIQRLAGTGTVGYFGADYRYGRIQVTVYPT